MDDSLETKFHLPVIIFTLLFVVLSDIGDLLGTLMLPIPILGQVAFILAKGYSLMVWLAVQLWLILTGERGLWFLAGSTLDLVGVPFAQTTTLMLTIYLANHPRAVAAVGVASGKIAGARTIKTADMGARGAPERTPRGSYYGNTAVQLSGNEINLTEET